MTTSTNVHASLIPQRPTHQTAFDRALMNNLRPVQQWDPVANRPMPTTKREFAAAEPIDRERLAYNRRADQAMPRPRTVSDAEADAVLDRLSGGGRKPAPQPLRAPRVLSGSPRPQAVDGENPSPIASSKGFAGRRDPDLPRSARRAEASYALRPMKD